MSNTETPLRQARPRVDAQTGEIRRANLQMLTATRGSKQVLASLAGMNSSRISLMTSARKPVSDPFSIAIEDALSLPRGWMDTPHEPDEVSNETWRKLGGFPEDAVAAREAAARAGQTGTDPFILAALAAKGRATTSGKQLNPLFNKPVGQIGPIAEALAKTIIKLSQSEKLSEEQAFELLGKIISDYT
ncbi:hypothetical protein [Azoarcus taiwanensis]|uniref:Uncharacterized protein n=1 Tax=Azoarcus taiwanensis TaxID=666964 RepID=A0A972FHF4_9RHOO|nr:hypothetical protein [Azoarcus taiwanensis]NMG02356.1 hypothetical protein [Azoarcus taiwanensis]